MPGGEGADHPRHTNLACCGVHANFDEFGAIRVADAVFHGAADGGAVSVVERAQCIRRSAVRQPFGILLDHPDPEPLERLFDGFAIAVGRLDVAAREAQ